jgi:hypothetical protein
MERRTDAWGYNWTTLLLADIYKDLIHQVELGARLIKKLQLHFIAFCGCRVSQNGCRLWNMPYIQEYMYNTTEVLT